MLQTPTQSLGLDPTDSQELIAKLKGKVLLGDRAETLITEAGIKRTTTERVRIATSTLRSLGVTNPTRFEKAVSEERLGIKFCSIEIACQYRLQYDDQPTSEVLFMPVMVREKIVMFCISRYYCGEKLLYAYPAESFLENIGPSYQIVYRAHDL